MIIKVKILKKSILCLFFFFSWVTESFASDDVPSLDFLKEDNDTSTTSGDKKATQEKKDLTKTPCESDKYDHPLSIWELLDIALSNNPATQRSWADAQSAAFNYMASRSILYPFVTLQETATTIDQKSRQRPGSGDTFQGQNTAPPGENFTVSFQGFSNTLTSDIAVSYLLLDFGGRDALIESTKQALFAARWTYDQEMQNVVIDVLRAYYAYLQNKAFLEAKELDIQNAKSNLDAAEHQFAAGVKTRLDMLQAKSNLLNTQLAAADLQGQVKISLGTLSRVVGLPANARIEVADFPNELPVEKVTQDIDTLIDLAKVYRADLASAISTLYQKEADITVARATGLPTITTNLNFSRVDYSLSPLKESHVYQGSLVLNIPLFDGFLSRNLTQKAMADWDSAYADWEDKELQAMLDVLTNYYTYQTAIEDIKFSEEYLKYAQEAYDAASTNYREGVGTILDLLSTQVTLSNARAQVIQAKAKWITALSNLVYSTGML